MKNPAGPKVRTGAFYDVSSWQQVTKTITWDLERAAKTAYQYTELNFYDRILSAQYVAANIE